MSPNIPDATYTPHAPPVSFALAFCISYSIKLLSVSDLASVNRSPSNAPLRIFLEGKKIRSGRSC